MISFAYAQSTENLEYSVSIWNNPTLWVAISFGIFVMVFARPAWRFVTNSIDEKIDQIRNRMEEATELREEAQDILAANKRKMLEAEKEAGEIIAHAREEALALKTRLSEELQESLKRREKMAVDRISQAEADAVEAVRLLTIDVALNAAEQILTKNVKGERSKSLIDNAIKELPDKLN